MTKISSLEVATVARIAHIEVREGEMEPLIERLEDVLTYAARVQQVSGTADVASTKNVNVCRGDIVYTTNSEPLRMRAPEREGDYFVVPIILENSR
jgi:aspartyl/glutamyl-tRNA(Asn/Gln) amidotransferase C subunit